MRSTWSGMISFGLVNIPVKLYNAARDERVKFHQMHKEDSGRVGYQKVCKVCGEVLENDDITQGYEYKKGQYVLISDEELDKIDLPTTKTVSVLSFVDASEIEPLQYDRGFYIGPDENGERAYALLRKALQTTGKVAVGKIALRTREQLATIRVAGDALALETLHYANEMVKADDIGIPAPDGQVADNELDLAKVLIEHMAAEFDPSAYRDEYEAALNDLINKKIEGEEVTAPPAPQATNVIDIVGALKASLAEAEREPEKVRKSA